MEGSRISKRTIPTRVPGAATVGSGQYRKVTGACQQVPARREIGAMFVTPQYHGEPCAGPGSKIVNMVRQWLCAKFKVPGRGWTRYPDPYLYQELRLYQLQRN